MTDHCWEDVLSRDSTVVIFKRTSAINAELSQTKFAVA